jgi:putative ABC transport system permease protein
METLLRNLRHGLRNLAKSPGFTSIAILTLALGIGANTAIFSVVDTVLLQPLSYPDADRLVELELSSPQGNSNITSIPKFNIWHEQAQVFDSVTAYDFAHGINVTGGERPEQLKGIHASADYFRVFGAPVVLGRTYTAEEDRPGGPAVVVVSNGLWRSRFGADSGIIGRTIDLGGELFTVIGVLGSTFKSDPPSDLWVPLKPDPNSTDQGHYLRGTARLKAGVTVAQAQAAMKLAAEQFKQKFPKSPELGPGDSFTAIPLRDSVIGDVRSALWLLFGAVGFVLLIACANVANLLLARGTIRRREMAIRSALGAGRMRLIWQLLTESLLLAFAGAVLGLALGYAGVRALLAMNPGSIPRIGEHGAAVTLDWRVVAFTLAAALFTGILFGLAPALSASSSDLSGTLRESGSRTGSSVGHNRARSVLVVTEMALALILLVGAVLLIRTFGALRAVHPGFDAHNVLTMEMSLAGKRFEKAAAVDQLERDGRQRLESLPGVVTVTLTCCMPLEGGFGLPFNIEGQPPKDGPYTGGAGWISISPRYFDVFRIPVIKGRSFNDRDNAAGSRVAIVNEEFARKFFSKDDAVGARITIGKGVGPEFDELPREIVGVVGDVRQGSLDQPPDPIMYVPTAQVNDGVVALNNRIGGSQWLVLTKVQPFSLSDDIQRALREASGGLPVAHVRSMQQVVGESTARNDFYMTLLTIFASVALLLAAVGVYGLMAYSVQQRTQEIGVRMALGASSQQVRRMVVTQGMKLSAVGVVIGIGSSLALARVMKSMLYGVKPWDPLSIMLVAILLTAVTLLAAYIPARRASRVDPMVALRYE